MKKRRFFFKYIFPCLIGLASSSWADSITWTAQTSNGDMNDSANWTPNMVPGSGDEAVFNSALSGVNTNPTENSAPFSVSRFNFLRHASIFQFSFNNQTLTFTGTGITGTHTNPTINVIHTNNSSFPGDLISFTGGTATSGSSLITSSNSGILSGNLSNEGSGAINSNLHANGNFTMTNGGSITASNTGNDSTIGTGNNGTANTAASQLRFDQSFSAGDHASVSVVNSGTFSGTNSVQGNSVAIVNGSQFISTGAFQTEDNFSILVQNTGNDSSLGVGLSNIGQLNAAQVNLQSTASVGKNCTFTISNTGINSSQTTNFEDFIAYLNDQQFFVGSTFEADDHFSLTVSNTGLDTSTGHGHHQVAVINSNSGTTGNQILFQQGCALGDYASIAVSNSGTYSGTNNTGGSNVAGMNLQQIAIGESTAPGAHDFVTGDHFSLNASNNGLDSSNGLGGNAVGTVSSDQITFYTPVNLGNHATINIANGGNFSGTATSSYVNVGSAGGNQLNSVSSFSTGNHFILNVSNSGTNTGSGIGGYFIGDLTTGQQVAFKNGLILGDNATISIANSGSNTSNTINNNQVGSFMGYGKQLLVKNPFQVGNGFHLQIANSGYDASSGSGGNFVGFINNNTADNTASQFHLDNGGNVGNGALISLSNSGTYEGTNSVNGNVIGVLAGQQMFSVNDFYAGNDFGLSISNAGLDNASGQSSNSIGTVGGSQVEFGAASVLGNNASILLSNSGTNNDTMGTLNNIGVINGSQMLVNGNFTAGTALNISATNRLIDGQAPDNFVGHITGSQLNFAQNCTLNDRSMITAFNSGTIGGSQIVFGQGFNVASGKVTIQALNEGTVGSFGIDVQGSSGGGNAHIRLGNSSLNIATTLPTFTIAGLDGDSTSFAQSQPQLIIDTDALTHAEFSGVIQNFPATSSTLLKTGAGTQILSGINTYTGLTTVQEGNLVLNGALAGDVLTNSFGTLKGNGTIGGTLTNAGTVSPGESIGTLIVANYINNSGTYDVEVNGLGQNDLIDVLGTATINGGNVLVSSADGTFRFQQPYTILTAEEGVTGTFTGATSLAFITPLLSYDQNNVYLTLRSALINAAEKCNQRGVAINLDNIVSPNSTQSLLIGALANLPLTKAQQALESLSGFQYTHDVLVTEISTGRFLRRLYDPLKSLVAGCGCSPACQEWTPWLETGYGYTDLHGNTAHSLHFGSYQVTGGIQKTWSAELTLGLAGSYEYDHVTYRDGKSNRDTGFASLYGLYRPSLYYGLFDVVYGSSSHRFKRTIEVGNLDYKAHSAPHCNNVTFYGEGGIDLRCDYGLIQPFVGVQVGKNWRGQINEKHAKGWGLKIKKHDWSSTRSRLGVHFTFCHLCDSVDTSFDLAWNQLWSSSKNTTEGRFKQFGHSFPICGNKLDHYSFDYALTLTTCFCDNLKGYFELDGEWWRHANTFNILGGIIYSW